jgi:propanol-preferring alcohol dehydrogenase
MVLKAVCSLDEVAEPLSLEDIPQPQPGPGELLLEITACGVCHTELDEIEGRTPPPALPVVPGHEVVGHVVEMGEGCSRHAPGDRVGVGWIHSSDGSVTENIAKCFAATGRDVNGGYAEYMTVPEAYAYPIPAEFSDIEAAPLLCAGGVGYRSLMLAELTDGEALGLTGFGGSGHLVLQLARYLYPRSPVFVFARSRREREFAMQLGADWAGDTESVPPAAPQAIIDTTPAWRPVLAALACLRPGGRLVINAIRKEDADRELMAGISYETHLWQEKEIKTVANVTHRDIARFLPVAAEVPLHVEVEVYPLEAANRALRDLRAGGIRGAKVLRIKQ